MTASPEVLDPAQWPFAVVRQEDAQSLPRGSRGGGYNPPAYQNVLRSAGVCEVSESLAASAVGLGTGGHGITYSRSRPTTAFSCGPWCEGAGSGHFLGCILPGRAATPGCNVPCAVRRAAPSRPGRLCTPAGGGGTAGRAGRTLWQDRDGVVGSADHWQGAVKAVSSPSGCARI